MKTIKIKEDVKIGSVILEAGDQIRILKETIEEIESMESPEGDSVVDLINDIVDAFDMWVEGSRDNFDDDEAREWGYRGIEPMIQEVKQELIKTISDRIEKVAR